MKVQVNIPKNLLANIRNTYKDLVEPVMVAVGTETQHELSNQKPPPPRKGSKEFVSDKQRRYVMAAIREGKIEVPYRRGMSPGSQRMARSFRLVRAPGSLYITNSAAYMDYVIGRKQARIHQGRWKTGQEVAERVIKDGIIEDTVAQVLEKKFPGHTRKS